MGQLIYVGSTIDFNKRWNEHKNHIKNILIDGSKLKADKVLTATDFIAYWKYSRQI